MKYPEKFIKKVKRVYRKDFFGLYEGLDKGEIFVGRILDDSRGLSRRKNKLYGEWCEIYDIEKRKAKNNAT